MSCILFKHQTKHFNIFSLEELEWVGPILSKHYIRQYQNIITPDMEKISMKSKYCCLPPLGKLLFLSEVTQYIVPCKY